MYIGEGYRKLFWSLPIGFKVKILFNTNRFRIVLVDGIFHSVKDKIFDFDILFLISVANSSETSWRNH